MGIYKYLFIPIAVLLIGCSVDVKYEVEETASTVNVYYEDENNNISSHANIGLPFHYEFRTGTHDDLRLSILITSDTGDVVARIYQNGHKTK